MYEQMDWWAAQYHYPGKSYDEILRIRGAKERRRRREAINHLRRRKLVEIQKTEQGLMVMLTDAGAREAVREAVRQNRMRLPSGQSCIVIFDVPEQSRAARDALRAFLRDAGFAMVQRSVWESRYDVFRETLNFITAAGVRDWVRVIDARLRS